MSNRRLDCDVQKFDISGIRLGHYFVFVDDAHIRPASGKKSRLFAKKEHATNKVIPVLSEPITSLEGLTISPPSTLPGPLASLVSDRDLYRAEHDTVHLFAALPAAPEGVELVVTLNAELFTRRPIDLGKHGTAVEALPMLLAGSYGAWLTLDEQQICPEVSFTVAEYTLAPLSGRLGSYQLDRKSETLSFELAVESYQAAYLQKLSVSLVEAGREVATTELDAESPGRYRGQLRLSGEGPLRLRLSAIDDPSRIAEVAIPGSRAVERELSVINELGEEIHLSMMPESGALSVRGGFLSRGGPMQHLSRWTRY